MIRLRPLAVRNAGFKCRGHQGEASGVCDAFMEPLVPLGTLPE